MKRIKLLCVGEQKLIELKKLEEKYLQWINYYVKFTLKNLKSPKIRDETIVKKKEGELILRALDEKDYVIALDEKGKKMDSPGFSRFLEDKISNQSRQIIFLIGGFAGLSPLLDKRVDYKISFSAMTISHDIFRVVFLEQLYRALTIIKGMKYHR
jgi:23S rRNA (pseudouridine1915-N3)-methyltransferase